ncbi:hypothetical protein [Pontibacter akesuensis]|uniref:Uncharacterized protein n=1 Tax=Pontibacter akesuensis TaxID=388950 RepID=A0A1I7H0S4_9BACT|nr:hypothetical protein [Pontibacter akesuensis]GHA54091.1 hypothetical protein GCM10007389_01680 [Pontibacter akesuensis]SFU54324.1 hypothetical protein SAMN04487941_1411 [Pontibacter akesuensis]
MAKYDGSEGEAIALSQAAEWTRNYRNKRIDSAEGEIAKAHFFGRNILNQILEQENCVGIRMYYAEDNNGQKQLILVGATAEGEDIENGIIADRSRICPPDCVESGLND